MKNNAYNIHIKNIKTGEDHTFSNKRLAGDYLDMCKENITHYINNVNVYKETYIISKGENHQKVIEIEVQINAELLTELNKLIDQVKSANLKRLTNTICRDFIHTYRLNKNIIEVRYDEKASRHWEYVIKKTRKLNEANRINNEKNNNNNNVTLQ